MTNGLTTASTDATETLIVVIEDAISTSTAMTILTKKIAKTTKTTKMTKTIKMTKMTNVIIVHNAVATEETAADSSEFSTVNKKAV